MATDDSDSATDESNLGDTGSDDRGSRPRDQPPMKSETVVEAESPAMRGPHTAAEVTAAEVKPNAVERADPNQPQTHQRPKPSRARDKRKTASGQGLTPLGFSVRFMAALVLVFGTYNPSGTSYYHWVATLDGSSMPSKILAGLLVLAGWVVFFRATSRSLGPIGALLAAAVCGVALWWLIDLDVVAQTTTTITYAALFIVSVILTLGLTGSFLWRRLTGQYHVDADDGGMDD